MKEILQFLTAGLSCRECARGEPYSPPVSPGVSSVGSGCGGSIPAGGRRGAGRTRVCYTPGFLRFCGPAGRPAVSFLFRDSLAASFLFRGSLAAMTLSAVTRETDCDNCSRLTGEGVSAMPRREARHRDVMSTNKAHLDCLTRQRYHKLSIQQSHSVS